jgi:hypothetical protein
MLGAVTENLRKIFLMKLRAALDTWDIQSLVGKLGPPNLVAQKVCVCVFFSSFPKA